MRHRITTFARLRDAAGLSLAELIVVMALLGTVVAVSYASLQGIQSSANVSDKQALYAREVTTPLHVIEEVLMQNSRFSTVGADLATPYKVVFFTDRDVNDQLEKYTLTATADNELRLVSVNIDATGATTSQIADVTLSRENFNVARGIPLIRYFENGTEITDVASSAHDATEVRVTVVTAWRGQDFQDSRRIYFRMR